MWCMYMTVNPFSSRRNKKYIVDLYTGLKLVHDLILQLFTYLASEQTKIFNTIIID